MVYHRVFSCDSFYSFDEMLSLSVTLIQIDCFESDASVVCVCVWGGGGGGGDKDS